MSQEPTVLLKVWELVVLNLAPYWTVHQVLADPWQVVDDGDAVGLQQRARPAPSS